MVACIFGFFWLATFPASGSEIGVSPELDLAVTELRVSVDVWRDNDTEYRSARRTGSLPKEEMTQFAAFVAELKRRVLEDCQAVRVLGGEQFLARHECDRPENAANLEEPPR